MANQDFTRENKKPTTHDKQKRLAEEELEKRISRLQLAIKKEKDPKLKQEISLLLQQYETEHKNLLQKNRFRTYLIASVCIIGVIIAILFLMFLKDSSRPISNTSTSKRTTATSSLQKKDKTNKTKSDRSQSQKTRAVFPVKLRGTWYGYVDNLQKDIQMTFSKNGVIKTVIGSENYTSRIKNIERVGVNTYCYHFVKGTQPSGLVAGAQLGGVYVRYAYGVYIGDGYIKPLVWQTGVDSDFDYSQPLTNIGLDYQLQKGRPSSQKSSHRKSSDSQVDTKNLTTQQVEDWVIANYLENRKDSRFTKKDFTIESWKSDTDGLVYATIKENHQSDAMKQAGADSNTSPTVAHYRINANGELEKSSDGLNSWTVVSRTYYND